MTIKYRKPNSLRYTVPLFFVTLVCSACANRYSEYADLRGWEAKTTRVFPALSEIRPIGHRIWVSPDDGNGDVLASAIDGAKRSIDLNVYLLSDTKLVNSLISAHRRRLAVRVILERSPYENPKGNADIFARLANEGIPVEWADETRQNFNHAKYVLADDALYLATSNFTATSFAKNREFLVETSDVPIVGFMKRLFEADFHKFPFRGTQENAYVSPTDSRNKLESYLRSAKKEVRLFAASLSDESLLGIFGELRKKGVYVYVCLAYESDSERMALAKRLKGIGVDFRQSKSPYVHAKTLLIDDMALFVWSENFTGNSLDQNRETWLILRESYFMEKYKEIIARDCRDI